MERSTFGRLGRLATRWPWLVVALWVVAFAVMGSLASGLSDRLTSGGFQVPGSDSYSTHRDLEDRFAQQYSASALVVVHHPTLAVEDPRYRDAIQAIAARVETVPHVAKVESALSTGSPAFVSGDRRTTYLVAGLTGSQSDFIRAGGHVSEAATAVRATLDPAFEVNTGGTPAFYDRLNEVSRQDLERAEIISFPITLLVLLVAFGSVVAAGLPIMLAIVSLVVTMGILYFFAGTTEMSVFVTNSASVIGIGVGIDYALFVVTRYREELRRGRDVRSAVVVAVASSGRAVALSGATVIVALSGLFLSGIQAFQSMAIGSIVVVAVAVLVAITLLPAVLALLGPNVDRLRIALGRTRQTGEAEGGFWHAWALAVMRRPWLALIASAALLLAMAIPAPSLRIGQNGPGILPADEGPRLATERLSAAFGPGILGPYELLVDAPGGATTRANLERVDRLARLIQADPAVERVVTLANVVPGADLVTLERLYAAGVDRLDPRLRPAVIGMSNWESGADLSRVIVVGKHAPESRQAEELLDRLRHRYVPEAGLAGQVRVGGVAADGIDLNQKLLGRAPLVIATVVLVSFLLLVLAFRSILLPIKAVLMNILSVAAAYGLIVAIFQYGWGEQLLGFTSEGHIAVFVPLFLFSILFGLSMDYEVFLMSRIREEYDRTGSNELAVAHGLEKTARTITSAAIIMVTVFAAFALSRVVPFKEMGFGLAAAVFIDATIVRTILVPAAMRLMGHWNWWMPAALDRLLPRIALESSGDEEPAPEPASA